MLGDAELTVTNVDVQELSCFSSKTDPSNFQLIRILGQGSFGKVKNEWWVKDHSVHLGVFSS